jgi:esterase/lipase superfamily enzyme
MHAANLFFRRPDLFDCVFAMSGLYDSEEFFGGYMDELVYNNCPVTYLANMPADHPYLSIYSQRNMIFTVGQGAWEGPLLESTRKLDTVCAEKGIPAQFHYWGFDVCHDWCWWFRMVELYVPQLLSIKR